MTTTATGNVPPPAGAGEAGGTGGTGKSGPGARRSARRRPRLPGRLGRGALPYLFLLPALVLELLIHLTPMVVGVVMSFRELTRLYIHNWGEAPWSGLDNYRVAVDFDGPLGESLLHSFLVTCLFTVVSVGLSWLLGTAAAVLMQDRFRGRGLLRALFLTPYALPVYAAVITWAFVLQRDNGMLNHIVHDQLGLTDQPPFWLIGDNAFFSLVVISVWRNWPFAFLILTAALQNIPREVYEAAQIDGAGVWQQIRRITLPSVRPVNQVLVLVLFLWTFNDFNVPYLLFGKAAPDSADLISVHIYDSSFGTWNFGYGSAMSVLLLLFLLLVTAVYLVFTSRGRRAEDG
ncbi:carbohydrate ABC transporter permease [Streptomyces hoynatensis]|uniref:Sugar ABC transporter permease n=1 Tax=Streptomyces hoynatensis TaxID=1141874 RepID=A0A3A9YT06_9ACTN|nr:sugar ABC transporter permease [Streptomyces hoynatensis]RKN38939.1 sugar ABC transporter permease [Streptomyces hoynatensis]